MSARTVALLPTGFVVASEAPSLFGGPPRTKLETLPTWARLDDNGITLSSTPPPPSEIAIDVVRLAFAAAADGNPRTAAAVARKGALKPGPPLTAKFFPNADALASAVANACPNDATLIAPASLTALGQAIKAKLIARGLTESAFPASASRVLADRFDVRRGDDVVTRICGASQAATLAAGLAPHLVALLIDSDDARDLWKHGYDELARRVCVLQAERQLLEALHAGSVCRLGGAASTIFVPLSQSEGELSPAIAAEVARLKATREVNPKIDALVAAFHQRRDKLLRALITLRAQEVEVRLPALQRAAEWWAKQDIALAPRVEIAGANDDLIGFLKSRSIDVAPAASTWFIASAPEAPRAKPVPVPLPLQIELPPPAPDVIAKPAPTAPPKPDPIARPYDPPFFDPDVLLIGPFRAGSLKIVVDGTPVADGEARLDITARRGDERIARVPGASIAHGAVVCIERDAPEDA